MPDDDRALSEAERALAAGDRPRALRALIEGWRRRRDPRLADLIDRVSDEHTATLPAIDAPTVAARVAAWQAIATRRDPADLGRLLAAPRPRTIDALTGVIAALIAWPEDPRIATALVRFVEDHVIPSRAGRELEVRSLERVHQLGDTRGLARLRAMLGPTNLRVQRAIEAAIAKLEATPPADPAFDARLARLATTAPPADDAGTEAALIAAIHADPDDPAARAVYADWLGERADPRGELIALQLATARTPETARREAELIAEHGRRWVGALGRWFAEDGRVFDRGFFAGGRILAIEPRELDGFLADPALALVRRLDADRETEDLIVALLDRAELAGVRAVGVIGGARAAAIASGKPRALDELAWRFETDEDEDPAGPLATCRALPALRTIGIVPRRPHRLDVWAATAPVLERVERIVLPADGETESTESTASIESIESLLRALANRSGALRTIELRRGRRLAPIAWSVTLARTGASGPFTEVVARAIDDSARRELVDLRARLAAIPADWPRDLAVEIDARRWLLATYERRWMIDAVARFTACTRVSVPWDVPQAESNVGAKFALELHGPDDVFTVGRLPAVWAMLDELGRHYDTFTLRAGMTLRKLGKRPLERLLVWAKKGTWIEISRDDGGTEACKFYMGTTELTLRLDRDPRVLVDWIARYAELTNATVGWCHADGVARDDLYLDVGDVNAPKHGWIMLFGPVQLGAFDRDELAALPAAHPELDGFAIRLTEGRAIVVAADAPERATRDRIAAVGAALRTLVVRELVRRLGYDPAAVVRAVFDPAASALGYVRLPGSDLAPMYRHANHLVSIRIARTDPRELPRLTILLRDSAGDVELASRAQLEAALRAAIAELAALVAGSPAHIDT